MLLCTLRYDGCGVSCPVSEYGLASNKALFPFIDTVPVYKDRRPLLLFPNAFARANGVDAPLLTLPLISNRSAASSEGDETCNVGVGGVFGKPEESFTFMPSIGSIFRSH